MKNRNYIILGMVAILPALTSCSSEDSTSGESDRALTKISVSASINASASRVDLSEDATSGGLKESWSASDAFLVKDANALSATPTTLSKSNTDPGLTTSNFSGDLLVGVGDVLYGYYPSTLALTSGQTQALANYSMQGGTLAKVQKRAIMTATTTYAAGTVTNFPFTNTTAILRVKINLPVSVPTQITKLTISGTGLYNKKYLTLAADGTVTWANATKGDEVIVPDASNSTNPDGMTNTDGELTMYVAVIPQTLASGFTVTAQTKDYQTYYYNVTSSATFTTTNVHTVNVNNADWTNGYSAINSTTNTLWNGNYYCWDAGTTYSTTGNANTTTLNSAPATDEVNVAQSSCINCLTYNQLSMYLGAGIYWDTQKSWKDASGTSHTGGMWMKKACYISGFADGTANKVTSANFLRTITSSSDNVVTSDEYFFTPAAGYKITGTTTLAGVGTVCYYWLNSPNSTGYAGIINANKESGNAVISDNTRNYGFCLWTVQ